MAWETYNGRFYQNGDYTKDYGLGQIDPDLGHIIGTTSDYSAGGQIKVLTSDPYQAGVTQNVGQAGAVPGSSGSTTPQQSSYSGTGPVRLAYKSNAAGSASGSAPTMPTNSTNAGRTAVTLGNGQTIYYDHTGQAYDAQGNLEPAATIAASTISNPVTPPSGAGTPTLPNANAPSIADQFNTSLSATLQAQQNQLAQSLQQQTQNYQTKIDAMQKQSEQYQHMQELGLASEKSVIGQETADKQAALEQEQQQFKQNYDARQKLVDQLQTLLTTGQSVIEQMKGTTGLSSIMSPRISQTMADVQGQAGVITATLSAMSDQIGLAQNQLTSSLTAITSIYHDQLAYWDNVINFYNDQQKVADAKVASLSKDQQAYINAQIQMLQDRVSQTQKTTDAIQQAFLDPKTALIYSTAGVSLTDSLAQIGQKLATYQAAQAAVWSEPQQIGNKYVQTNTVTGEVRTVAAPTQPKATGGGSSSGGSTSSNNSKGKLSSKQFAELSLQRAGLTYQDALGRVPQGKVGVIDNATGQIGYIDPTEYNTKQYTYL
jgi:hypothetical protein